MFKCFSGLFVEKGPENHQLERKMVCLNSPEIELFYESGRSGPERGMAAQSKVQRPG